MFHLALLAGCDPESQDPSTHGSLVEEDGGFASNGGCDGTATTDGGVIDCDQRHALCDQLTPECPEGQVPSIVAHCFGPCVSEASCAQAVELVDCDDRHALCDSLTPEYPEGHVASVSDGCWGPCVPEASCSDLP